MAERVGFEPTERFPVHSISSAANSTTLAPLRKLPWDCDCRLQFRLGVLIESVCIDLCIDHSNRQLILQVSWRRGWDLNPRWSFPHSGFRDRCTKPLCDLSKSYATWGERGLGMGRWGDAEVGRRGDRKELILVPPYPRPRVTPSPRSPRLRTSASPCHPFSVSPRGPLSARRVRKNACINSRHSCSSTPVVNSIR